MATAAQTRAKKTAAEIRRNPSRRTSALELETEIRRVLTEAGHPLRAEEINKALGRSSGSETQVRNILKKKKLPSRRARIEGTRGAAPMVWTSTTEALAITRPDEVLTPRRRATKRTARKRTRSTTTVSRRQRSTGRVFTEITLDTPTANGASYALGSDGKLYVVRQLVEA